MICNKNLDSLSLECVCKTCQTLKLGCRQFLKSSNRRSKIISLQLMQSTHLNATQHPHFKMQLLQFLDMNSSSMHLIYFTICIYLIDLIHLIHLIPLIHLMFQLHLIHLTFCVHLTHLNYLEIPDIPDFDSNSPFGSNALPNLTIHFSFTK